jgi:RHS repeat-associated protein
MTDFNGHIVTYLYDEQNRLTEKQFADGSKVQYGYLRNGLQDTVTFRNSAGLVTSFYDYDYDVRDRLTKRTDSIDGVARSINYGYDIASNRTSVTTASGTTTYSYDDRNRLDVTRFNGAIVADYDYDAASRLTKTTFGNGTEETRVYDSLNRLKELTSQRGTTVLSKYLYTLDKVGNRKTATETVNGQNRSLAYTYDDLYRLTDEVIIDGVNGNRTSNYTYDFVGNRQTKTINGVMTTYAYDGNDRLRTEKVGSNVTATYDYDNNGSTTQKVENGVTATYVWNDEKRLISATVGTTQVEYVYNDQGIRVASKQNGVETRYLLDEGIVANVWEEYAPNGTVQASYVYGNDLITQTQAGQTSYYLVDGLGSTRLLTDAQGQVLNAYGYEAFGESTNQSGTTNNKYQYAGEQFDSALGDYYLRQRFYDTSSGRFGRMDTYEGKISSPQTLHKYLYANANPVHLTDPSGLFTLAESSFTISSNDAFLVAAFNVYGVRAYNSYKTDQYTPEALGGFGENSKPRTVLDRIFAWRNSWKPEPLGGFDTSKPNVPTHTGRSTGDTVDFSQYMFQAEWRGPAAKGFDWTHIMNNHSPWGEVAQKSKKDIFWGLSENGIKRVVQNAWKTRDRVETQRDFITGETRIQYRGIDGESGYIVEMWFNETDKQVETAYPIGRE